jgi:hypothetical protein
LDSGDPATGGAGADGGDFKLVRQRWRNIHQGCWNPLTIPGDDSQRDCAKKQWEKGYADRIKSFAESLDAAGLKDRIDFMRSTVPEESNEWIAWSLAWTAQHFDADKVADFMVLMQKDGQLTRTWWRIFAEYQLDSEFFDRRVAAWRLICPRCKAVRTPEVVRHDTCCERCSTRHGKFTLVLSVLRYFDRYGDDRGRNFET